MTQFISGMSVGVHSPSCLALCLMVSTPSWADDRHMMTPRVPMDQIEQARALTSPLPESQDIIGKVKGLYEGKGTCVNCHGPTGGGDGPVAADLDPSPRIFHHRGFCVIGPREKFFG